METRETRNGGGVATAAILLNCTDDELIQRYSALRCRIHELRAELEEGNENAIVELDHVERESSALAEELFNHRLRPMIMKTVGRLVFSKGMVPRNVKSPSQRYTFYEECVAQALYRLVDGICQFRSEATVNTYVSRISEREILTLIRRENGRYRDLTPIWVSIEDSPIEHSNLDAAEQVERERDDLLRGLSKALHSSRLALILVLRVVDNLSAQEVGDMLDLAPWTVHRLTRKATEMYREWHLRQQR